jgi:YfiH family protein
MNKFSIARAENGVWFGTFANLSNSGIKHGVSTRLGGLSQPPYSALNLGIKTGDAAAIVQANRNLFCQAAGVIADKLVTAQQVHGDRIYIVEAGDAGRGRMGYETSIPDTDALITNVAGIPLMLFFADCVPVLIADPVKKVVAVSHAGWRGTVAKIGQKTVLTMQDKFGTDPNDCLAAIGPSIGPCCYEVDKTVIDALQSSFSWWEDVVVPRRDRWMLDLWETNRRQLQDIGVKADNITISGVCTACNTELFYSHRAEKGKAGRLGAVIAL